MPMWPAPSGGSHRRRTLPCWPSLLSGIPGSSSSLRVQVPNATGSLRSPRSSGLTRGYGSWDQSLIARFFYHTLDAFILPSLYEGLPMAILEAMSSGVPIISSRLEGIAAVIAEGKEGLFAQAGDVADFSRQLSLLKGSPVFGAHLAQAARAKASREFSASATARRIESIYRQELGIANANPADKDSFR